MRGNAGFASPHIQITMGLNAKEASLFCKETVVGSIPILSTGL
jgi:hypothetical protein